MERRREEKRQRRNRHRIRVLIELLCMAGILTLVLINQKEIMNWMDRVLPQKDGSKTELISEAATDLESVTQPVENVSREQEEEKVETTFQAPKMNQDESSYHASIAEREKTRTANEENGLEARKIEESLKQKYLKDEIHGIFYSALRVSSRDKVEQILKSIEDTQINAVVIDVKDDTGKITYDTDNELANQIGAVSGQIWDISEMLQMFHEKGIYVIARVVAFRDPVLTASIPEYAVQNLDGSVFYDRSGDAWLNPYNEKNWSYLLEIADEAVELGFDEIQFDYVRFSTEAKSDKVNFGVDSEEYTKTEVITDFVQYAVKELHQQDAIVSADVFGTIISSEVDAKTVGQDYVQLSRYLDYICPMIYPSHYADGCYGLEVPDLQPYELILGALNDSVKELVSIDEELHCAVVRPWLQDFTASWKSSYQSYGIDQVNEQIQGVYDSGYTQWLLWNSSGKYSISN